MKTIRISHSNDFMAWEFEERVPSFTAYLGGCRDGNTDACIEKFMKNANEKEELRRAVERLREAAKEEPNVVGPLDGGAPIWRSVVRLGLKAGATRTSTGGGDNEPR